MSKVSDVRVGFVGLGNIAQLHADEIIGLGGQVVAGTDVSPEARAMFAEDYGAEVFEDHTEMYELVDAVVVSTPNRFHEEYVVAALEAGLDVLVEKPLAHTLESAQRIADVARDADGFCMVGFHNRFWGPVQVLNSYREQGKLGDVTHVEANYIRRRGVPGRGSWFTRKDVSGGGAVIDIGTHAIDLALYLMGYPAVEEVSASTRSKFGSQEDYSYLYMWGEDRGSGNFDVEDSATAFIRCANGSTISLEVAWAANREPSQDFYVRGTDAGAQFDISEDGMTVHETADDGVNHHRDINVETTDREAHGIEQQHFLQAVAAGKRPGMNTVEQGLEVQKIMDAIYRSSDESRAVSIE
jgi:predicted dehydrogenase